MTSQPSPDLGPFEALAEKLQGITEALAATTTQREVIEIVLTSAVQALGVTAGIVLLVDETDQQMTTAGSQGYEDGVPTLWQEGPIEHHVLIDDILRMKEARYFEDAGALHEAYPELESCTGGLLPVANATLPMFLDHRPLGVIVLDFTEPHDFTPAERRFLTILSGQCAVALGRAEATRTLEARVEERTRQLEEEQRARAEEALVASEAKYRRLFDSIDEGFTTVEVLFDEVGRAVDYRFLETNLSFERQTGIQNGVGRTMREIAPDHEDFWFEVYGQVAITGEARRFEHQAAALDRFYDVYAFRVGEPQEHRVAILFHDIRARKRAEEALRESELRRELAIDAAGLGTYVWYVQEDRPETDVRLLEMLGVKGAGEVSLANALANVIHPDDRDRYAATATRALDPDGDGKLAIEARFVQPGGTVKWIALTGQTVFEGEPRQAVRMYGTVTDITERKRAEERQVFLLELSDALRAEQGADGVANRALGLLAEHLRLDRCYIGVYRLEDDWGDFTHQVGNDRVPPVPSGVRLSDFPDALRVSFDSTLVIDDVARDERLSEVDRQNLGGLGLGALVAAALRKGERRPLWSIVAVTASPRQWTVGETALIEEVAERTWAATVRVHAETAVRASQERFSAVANLVPDLLWESEPDGFTNWYNSRWLEYTGQSFEQATGWGWADTIHPEDRDASAQRYREAVEADQPLRQEHRIRRYDGAYRWFAVDTVPVTDSHGQVVRVYGSATDIHDLHMLNTVLEARVDDRTQRLTDLNSELRTLATASSEEINEPLRRLRGFLHLLEGRIAEHLDDKTRRYFDLVQGEAVRAERLAEDFKALGYLEHRDLKPVLVPLVTLVLQVRTDLAPRLIWQTATWTVGPLPVVTGDAMLLRQAFTELLYHSLKLVPEGFKAQVEVNASSADGRVTLLVEVAPVKAGAADLRGDGLAIAKRVMQRHGGSLETELQGEHLQILLQLPGQKS